MGDELYQMYRTIKNGTGIQIKNLIGSGNGVRKILYFVKCWKNYFKTNWYCLLIRKKRLRGSYKQYAVQLKKKG